MKPPLSRKRAARVALVAVVFAAAAALAAAPTLLHPSHGHPPSDELQDALLALRAARSEGAPQRAPFNLARAEEAYAAALLERRRQELTFRWRRDYRQARAYLEQTLLHAGQAAALAKRSVGRDRTASIRALAAADAEIVALAGAEDRVWLADSVRQRLQSARTLVAEARSLLASGAHGRAREQAERAAGEGRAVAVAVHSATSRFTDDERITRWRSWMAETAAWSRRTGKTALVVDKDAHVVLVYQAGRVIREYRAELGWNNVSDKRHEGDGATPEGRYRIVEMKGRGRSRYHKALLLDYPNRDDMAALADLTSTGTLPRGTRPGGLIEIHGAGGRNKDWTDGCVAITNAEMDWVFSRVSVGTPVTIVGSLSGQGVFSDLARALER